MSYDNYYSLEITGEVTKTVPFCPTCKAEKQGKFCPDCGTPNTLEDVPKDKTEIIKELIEVSEDCGYLLDDDGSSNNSGSGWNIEDDIKDFSTKYPSLLFILDCDWDAGFGDPPSRYYYKNGKKQDAKAKVVYNEPNFDEDEDDE